MVSFLETGTIVHSQIADTVMHVGRMFCTVIPDGVITVYLVHV